LNPTNTINNVTSVFLAANGALLKNNLQLKDECKQLAIENHNLEEENIRLRKEGERLTEYNESILADLRSLALTSVCSLSHG